MRFRCIRWMKTKCSENSGQGEGFLKFCVQCGHVDTTTGVLVSWCHAVFSFLIGAFSCGWRFIYSFFKQKRGKLHSWKYPCTCEHDLILTSIEVSKRGLEMIFSVIFVAPFTSSLPSFTSIQVHSLTDVSCWTTECTLLGFKLRQLCMIYKNCLTSTLLPHINIAHLNVQGCGFLKAWVLCMSFCLFTFVRSMLVSGHLSKYSHTQTNKLFTHCPIKHYNWATHKQRVKIFTMPIFDKKLIIWTISECGWLKYTIHFSHFFRQTFLFYCYLTFIISTPMDIEICVCN